MIILASDTSTKTLSVALYQDGILLGGITEQTGTTHCQTHMPLIQKLLREAGLHFADIDLYACTVGPGSYTGIRIGVSTTKAMAYASNKNAIGVSTLETLAKPHMSKARIVCPILDARNRRVFSSGYLADELVVPEANRSIEDLLKRISEVLETGSALESKPLNPALNLEQNEQNKQNEKNENENENENKNENEKHEHEHEYEHENVIPDLIFCGDAASLYQEDPVVKGRMESLAAAGLLNAVSFFATVPEAFDVADIACNKSNSGEKGANAGDPFLLEAIYLSPSQAERMKKAEKPAGCEIRIATRQDLQDIYELEQDCFTIPWSIQSLETDLTQNGNVATYLVAVENGKVIGYIGMWQVLDEAQVTNLAVTKESRRKGVGRRLIQTLCMTAKERGAVQMTLEVRASNTPARTVYEGTGFIEIAIRKSYYKDNGEDAIIMLKNISMEPV